MFKNNNLLNNSFYSVLGTVLAGFFGYVLSFILSRQLTVVQFGEYQFFASVFVILGIVSAGLTYFVVKHTAVLAEINDYQANYLFINKIFKKISWPLAGFFILLLILALFFSCLKFYNLSALMVVCLSVVLSMVGSIYLGMFIGWQDFKRFALVNTLANLIRLLVPVLVWFYPSVVIATLSFFFYGLGTFVFGYWFSRKKWFKPELKLAQPITQNIITLEKRAMVSALLLSALTLVIGNGDILLIKYFFSAEVVGQYSVLALLGRMPFFISIAIIAVFLPKFCLAVNLADKKNEKQLFRRSYLFIGLINIFFIVFYYFFSTFILALSFGQNYVILSRELWLVAVMYLFFSLIVLKANQLFVKY
ncbi:MAG: oligosaccharide flippase family protein [Candidatus Magasanikiibacteriota bacterium]